MENRQTIFISYSSKDKATAAALCAHLEKAQLKCWIAPRDIAPGKDYAASIIEAINHSAIMILVFSQHSNDSDHVRNEVERAFHKRIEIIPFRISDTMPSAAMEYFLSLKHWLDAFEKKPALYFNEVQKICERLLDRTLDATIAGENGYVPQRADKKNKPLLYGLGILAVLLVGYFMWDSNIQKMKAPVNLDSIASNQNPIPERQRNGMETAKVQQEQATNTSQTPAEPPKTPNTPPKETKVTAKDAGSLGENDYFDNAADNEDYLRFNKKSGDTFTFEGKISGKSVSGDATYRGHNHYHIGKSKTIKGSFYITENQVTGEIFLLANGYEFQPKGFILYPVIGR